MRRGCADPVNHLRYEVFSKRLYWRTREVISLSKFPLLCDAAPCTVSDS
jgi:hypothetical protein